MNDREAFEIWFGPLAMQLGAMWSEEWKERDANGHYTDRAVWNAWLIWNRAVLNEREACARLAADADMRPSISDSMQFLAGAATAERIEKAIRSRL